MRLGCGVWCLLNVERYGVEEDGDGDEDEDGDAEAKKCKLFSRFCLRLCEVGGRRVCADRGK